MLDYYEYLASEKWRKLTEPIRERNGGICELCNLRFGTNVHHRTYERLGKELPEDLLHVCTDCHKMIHGLDTCYIHDSSKEFLEILQKEVQK